MRISDGSSDVCSSDLIPPPTDDERKELPLDQRLADPGECQRRSRTGRGAVGVARQTEPRLQKRHQHAIGLAALQPLYPRHRVWIIHRRHLQVHRSEEHTSELQSLMRISYAVL